MSREATHEKPHHLRRIAIILHEDSFYVRSVLRGVATYVRPHRPWLLERVPPEGFGRRRQPLGHWDGVITHVPDAMIAEALLAMRRPVVGVSNLWACDPIPRVSADDHAVGEVAARHLMDHGHHHLAYVGLEGVLFSEVRGESFAAAAAVCGREPKRHNIAGRWLHTSPQAGARGMRGLVDWLRRLPKPVGLFTCNDAVAWFISELCRQLAIEVPLSIAILGVDNDDLLCRLAYPPLSSVVLPSENIGYVAAQQLDLAMTRDEPVVGMQIAPTRVQTRQSSEFYAIDDPDITAALVYIRDHATEGLNVEDILRALPVSRRALERKFRNRLGRSPLEEIHRVRVEAAKQMLADSSHTIEHVAQQCGFGRANYMSRVLLRHTGLTPRQLRVASFQS